ncbi:MAG TPA: amidohydrolase family protein [Gemmatimonadales bacterium]|jgi:5-methylthioadenosine/S-adenosylhomocysteine deaminase|nr:amidohydrolase family protein [Gemmatimonadales bacterium]
MRARRLAARWLIPVEGAPIEHAALLIDADGRIADVGHDSVVARPPEAAAEEFGQAVIIPGLINTHTHLELTGFAEQIQEREFSSWIRRLRELKTTRTPREFLQAARQGLQMCYAAGVTTVADTGDSDSVIQVLAEADGSGIAYLEVFGPDPRHTQMSLGALRDRVIRAGRWAVQRVRVGVSPHAPYTVSAPLLAAVARWSRGEGLPLAVHIAESGAEAELLRSGSGPFAAAWAERGIPLPDPLGRTPIEWLAENGGLSELTLCIHAVQAGPNDIQQLADAGAAVAHCPLSNRAHGHGTAPLSSLIEASVRVGLGTDSEVSVGHLDLLAEVRAARELARLTSTEALDLCTLSGARALGLETETGSLRIGKWADCVVIRLAAAGFDADPGEHVIASSSADVMLTCVGGRDVYRPL